MRKYILWTGDDRRKVIESVHQMVVAEKIVVPFQRGVLAELLALAQQVLPEAKRKKSSSLKNLPHFQWVEEGVVALLVKRPEETPVAAPVVAGLASKQAELEDLIAESAALLFLDSDLGQRLVEKISAKIGQKLTVEVEKKLSLAEVYAKIDGSPDPLKDVLEGVAQKRNFVSEVVVAKPRLPKVVIAGGMATMHRDLEEEYAGVLDLRFMDTNQFKGAGVLRCVEGADFVVLAIKWLGHPQEKAITRLTQKWERVNGGTSDIKRCLNARYKLNERKVS